VDHGRADVLVAERFLDDADAVARLEEVGREGMAQRLAARVLDVPARLTASFIGRWMTVSWT